MKIAFTSDWHIKLGQKNVPVEWAKNRFRNMWTQLKSHILKNEVDLLIVGGDVFDRLPTLEELAVYFEFLLDYRASGLRIIVYSGNHEAVKKNTTFLSCLKEATKAVNPNATIIDGDYYSEGDFEILPYNGLKSFVNIPFVATTPILFTHVRGEIPPHVHPEIDLSLFESWNTVFAGDLHSHSNSQRNIVYSGSPVTTSFHRAETDTGFIVIDTVSKEWDFVRFTLPQLIRKTVSTTKDMVKTDYHHTIYELEGDMQEMAKVQNVELLDKKIVAKDSVSSLGLKADMTISEELDIYLKRVLLIDDEKAKLFIQKFNDYIPNA